MDSGGRLKIFISHSEEQAAKDLRSILSSAFPDQINAFNSTEAAQGLSSGSRIEDAVLDRIEDSVLFISLWTPHSVNNPAWMAWELGAARSKSKHILVARALGVQVRDLPLSLPARVASDLGDRESVLRFVADVAERLGIEIDEPSLKEFIAEHSLGGFLERRTSLVKVQVSLHGEYLLVENVSAEDLEDLHAAPLSGSLPQQATVVYALDRTFVRHHRRLSAGGRLVSAMPKGLRLSDLTYDPDALVDQPQLDQNESSAIRLRWVSIISGREWEDIRVFDEE